MPSLSQALQQFDAVEANLCKLDALWKEILSMIPPGIAFGDSTGGAYNDRRRAFADIAKALPAIDGWRLPVELFDLNDIGQMRFEAAELGEFDCSVMTEESIHGQDRHLQEYRYRFNKKRRALVRSKLIQLIDEIDGLLQVLAKTYPDDYEPSNHRIENREWKELDERIATIDTLLGSSISRPPRWGDLQRHLNYHMVQDLIDIRSFDWPEVKAGISGSLYGADDPLPTEVQDLGELVASEPSGDVVSGLAWENLDEDNFERLIFTLISRTSGYENPQWLTRTNAPDRGRDLSVFRVVQDALGGTIRQRIIIQCKHWLSRSVALPDLAASKEQMKLWEPPRVDCHIIATSGRFTTDAVDYVERHNQSDSGLRLELWPDSHLERLLAARPAIVAEFALRRTKN